MRKKSIIFLTVICLIVATFTLVACKKDPPAPKEGVVYQTGVQSFWAGVGSAYITFEHIATPETPEEGKLYGDVFNVNVSSDSGKTYASWLSGTWKIDGDKLTLKATWQDGDKATKLADATSGEEKTYQKKDGKFVIGVKLPSVSNTVNFELTVGDATTTACTEHVDANNDGKCDKCGADMPAQPAKQVQLALNAKAESGAVNADGKLELFTDNTWMLSISYDGGANFVETASGTWAIAADYSKITLTVTKDEAGVLANEPIEMSLNAADPQNVIYAVTMGCNVPQVGRLTFAFTNEVKAQVQLTMLSEANASGQTAKIEMMTDGTWKLGISYYAGGEFTETASGTWTMNGQTSMTLTVTKDEANVLSEDAYTVPFDFTTTPGSIVYSLSLKCTVPQVGELNFALSATMAIPQ